MSSLPRKPPGFSLVELLVVIAIIVILIALLLPAIQAAWSAGSKDAMYKPHASTRDSFYQCLSVHGVFPFSKVEYRYTNPNRSYNRSIVAFLSPYMEMMHVYEKYTFDVN